MNEQIGLKKSLRIGITVGLNVSNESLWINGIKQNALFLAKLFKNSPLNHEVTLLNTTNVEINDQTPWDLNLFQTKAFDVGCDGLDVVIELGGQINAEQTQRIKSQGTKLVSYCCGPEYVQNIEAMIFGRQLWGDIFINEHYDELWVIPQIWDLNRGFLKSFRKCSVKKVPFVWDPMFLEASTKDLANQGAYEPTGAPKRLSIIEPNIDVLKFCLYPILIAELAFRKMPQDIGYLHVANSEHLALSGREFAKLMHKLEIVEAQKASFIGRVTTPEFLSHHTDVVISHQWGLPLNYFYLECCWQGYPLIHNAELVADLGYYYTNHDLDEAAQQLSSAITSHDQTWQAYKQNQRRLIQRFLATNQELIGEYDMLLKNLIENRNGLN